MREELQELVLHGLPVGPKQQVAVTCVWQLEPESQVCASHKQCRQ